MKIQVVESSTNRPLANTKIQLQIKGKDSGFITLTTDTTGTLTLDSKYEGQQILAMNGMTKTTSQNPHENWATAKDGGRLELSMTGTQQKTTETHGNRTK